jgi:hypothetical protein
VSEVEVKKAMLECGYPSPYEIRSPNQPTTLSDVILTNRCMVSSGFTYDGGRDYLCGNRERLAACSSEAAIPIRDVGRRLNGAFCRAHSDDPACR